VSFIRKIVKAVVLVPVQAARGLEDAILDVTDPKEKK
jgi:hypothetical protein